MGENSIFRADVEGTWSVFVASKGLADIQVGSAIVPWHQRVLFSGEDARRESDHFSWLSNPECSAIRRRAFIVMSQNRNLFGTTQNFGELVIPLYHKKKRGRKLSDPRCVTRIE